MSSDLSGSGASMGMMVMKFTLLVDLILEQSNPMGGAVGLAVTHQFLRACIKQPLR